MQKIKELYNDVFYAPYSAFVKLYEKRLIEEANVPFEKYIKRYSCINVDGNIYCNEDDFRYKKYRYAINHDVTGTKEYTMMPDAVVICGYVIKNRYGYNT